jgi:hypothetical protein
MSLWKRAPRAVYRVYDEDEYLEDGATSWEGAQVTSWEEQRGTPHRTHESDGSPPEAPVFYRPAVDTPLTGGAGFGRIGGVALLATATVAFAAVIAAYAFHSSRLVPRARARQAASPAAPLEPGESSARPARAVERGSPRATPRLRHAMSSHPTRRAISRRRPTATSAKKPVDRQPRSHLVSLPAPSQTRERSFAEAAAPPPSGVSANGANAEFGFER